MNIDLHIHSTASDGRLTPAEVVARAAKLGMSAIAITDHDSVKGIESALTAARKYPDLRVIPGVEMGAEVPSGEMHILGYFVNHKSTELQQALKTLRDSRANRVKRMIVKLDGIGIEIQWEDVSSLASGASLGRPHLAQALLNSGHTASIDEAFERYIGHDGPAFVVREKMTPLETVELITRTGGLAVLAHPARTADLDATISELKSAGLVGMEVYYKDYDHQTINRLREIADNHQLIACGGSDYHGFEDGNEIGQCDVPQETVDQLIHVWEQRQISK